MIAREVRLSEEAEHDVESIYDYIATHDSIAAAEHVWAALEKTWTSLETLSERGNFPKEIAEDGEGSFASSTGSLIASSIASIRAS